MGPVPSSKLTDLPDPHARYIKAQWSFLNWQEWILGHVKIYHDWFSLSTRKKNDMYVGYEGSQQFSRYLNIPEIVWIEGWLFSLISFLNPDKLICGLGIKNHSQDFLLPPPPPFSPSWVLPNIITQHVTYWYQWQKIKTIGKNISPVLTIGLLSHWI